MRLLICGLSILLGLSLAGGRSPGSEVSISVIHQDFGVDPGWEGSNNRVKCQDCPKIAQDFGWTPANRTGKGIGEIGGVIWRSTTPAYYAMPLGPFSFRDKLSASGRIAVKAPPREGVGFYIGFFNDARQGWRVWSSCGFRIGDAVGGKARLFLDYKTGSARGAILNPDLEIPCNGSVHDWELIYEPDAIVKESWPDSRLPLFLSGGRGMREEEILERAAKVDPAITLERIHQLLLQARDAGLVDDWYRKGLYHLWTLVPEADRMKGRISFRFDNHPPVSYFLLPEHREDPSAINRFGVYNMQIYHGSLEFSLSGLTVNGTKIELDQDPHWDSLNNRVTFQQEDFHARQNFGYSQTNWAGSAPGEIGGRFWGTEVVDPLHAYYADDIGRLTLEDPITFSGSVTFAEGAVDGRMLLGYFNRAARVAAVEGEYKGNPPPQFMGIEVMDQTAIGYSFTAVCSPRQDISFEKRGPRFIPDRLKRPFSFRYDPSAGAAGRITMALGGDTHTADLTPEQRKAGAVFDRFGLLNPRKGGKYVDVYFDDLDYAAHLPQGFKPIRHRQAITVVPYPEGGRKF